MAFEAPGRVPATLAVLADLDPERQVAVCRELTKVHEEVVRGSAAELAERYAGSPPKGEVVLVVGAGAGGLGRGGRGGAGGARQARGRRRQAARGRERGRRSSPGTSANALYRAHRAPVARATHVARK